LYARVVKKGVEFVALEIEDSLGKPSPNIPLTWSVRVRFEFVTRPLTKV
jgi:hypothetical protein